MKRKIQSGFIVSLALLFAACQKESKELSQQIPEDGSTYKSNNSGGCRMTQFHFYESTEDYHSYDNFTYKNGLLDTWTTSGFVLKMEYDSKDRMKRSKGYLGNTLFYKIDFVWDNNRLVKEKWYDGATNDLLGKVIHIYNNKGLIKETDATDFGYTVLYEYANNGDPLNWKYYVNGSIVVRADYIYLDNKKNLWLSVTGLELPFFYANSGIHMRKRWESSEKWTTYDAVGNPTVRYDLDPTKTIWEMASQNYFTKATYTNQSNTITVINEALFENCKGGHNNNHRISQPISTLPAKNHPRELLHNPMLRRSKN